MSLEQCSLERLIAAARECAEHGEGYGILVAACGGYMALRVVVGREPIAHVDVDGDLDGAIVRAVAIAERHAVEAAGQVAFAEAATW